MAKTRQLIADGFLQDVFAEYLSKFSELQLEYRELVLELVSAKRTDRTEDHTSWWELLEQPKKDDYLEVPRRKPFLV